MDNKTAEQELTEKLKAALHHKCGTERDTDEFITECVRIVTHHTQHQTEALREENEKLRADNERMRAALTKIYSEPIPTKVQMMVIAKQSLTPKD